MSCLDGRTVAGCSWHSGDIQRLCKPFTAGLLLWATTPHASLQSAFAKVVSTCFQYLSCFSMLIFTSLLSKRGQKMPKPPTLPFCTASCPPSKCSSPKLDQHFQHWKESNLTVTSSFPASFRTWDKTWVDRFNLYLHARNSPSVCPVWPISKSKEQTLWLMWRWKRSSLVWYLSQDVPRSQCRDKCPIPWCIDKTKDAAMLLHHRLHGLQHIGTEALLSLLKLQMHVQPGSSDWIALIKSFKRWKWTEKIDCELVLLDCLCIADQCTCLLVISYAWYTAIPLLYGANWYFNLFQLSSWPTSWIASRISTPTCRVDMETLRHDSAIPGQWLEACHLPSWCGPEHANMIYRTFVHNVSIIFSYHHEIREISRYPLCSTKLLPLVCASLRKHIRPNSWRTPIRLAPMGPSRYCAFAGNRQKPKGQTARGSKAPRPSPWSPTFHQHKSARATGCWWDLGKAKAVEQWGLADHQHNPVCQDPNTIGAGCSYQDLDLQKAGSNKMQ